MTQVTYRERLFIPWWWIIIAALFVVSIAVVVFFSMEPQVAIGVSVLALLGVGLFLLAYSRTLVSVEDGVLTAGRNRIEAGYIAGAEALEGEAAREALGPAADHRSFLFTRPFVRDVVRVDLADPADPHPSWLISTRRPKELAEAIRGMA